MSEVEIAEPQFLGTGDPRYYKRRWFSRVSPAAGDVATWDSTYRIWKPQAITASAGGAPIGSAFVTVGSDATLTAERAITAGSGVSIVDGGANSTVTISLSGAAGHTIQEDSVSLTQRANLNFVEPDATILTDDAGNNQTDVTMSGYFLLAGRAGGQTGHGGTAVSEVLTLRGSSFSNNVELRIGTDNVDVVTKAGAATLRVLGSSGNAPETMVFLDYNNRPVGSSSLTFRSLRVFGTLDNSGRTGTVLRGLDFVPVPSNGTFAEVTAIRGEIFPDPFGPATITAAYGLRIVHTGVPAAGSGTITGAEIGNMGHANFPTVTALDILSQTAGGTSTFNIRQQGTTGINRFAAQTLIGDDSTTPAAGYALHVVGDQAISSQLVVGATSAAVANVALQLVGGRLRMAASTNDFIENSAGTRMLTFATNATANTTVLTVAGDLRINGNDILDSAAATHITLASSATTAAVITTFRGDIRVNGQDLLDDGGSIVLTFTNSPLETTAPERPFRINGNILPGSGISALDLSAISFSPTASSSGYITEIGGVSCTFVEAGSGNHPLLASLFIGASSIFAAAATVTDTASLYIAGAMAATVSGANYALWVDAGTTRLDGDLDHNGSNVGFYGATPVGRQAYTPTNVTTDRNFDANATTLDELADVVGTIIADLQSVGLMA